MAHAFAFTARVEYSPTAYRFHRGSDVVERVTYPPTVHHFVTVEILKTKKIERETRLELVASTIDR